MIRKSPYEKVIMAQTVQPERAQPTAATLPDQEIARDVLLEKYAKGGEASRAVVRGQDLVPPPGEPPGQHVAIHLVVFDQKDLRHRRSSLP